MLYFTESFSSIEKLCTHRERGFSHSIRSQKISVSLRTILQNYNRSQTSFGTLGQNKPIPPLAAARVQRWALLLSAYIYVLEYKPGANHANSDCLSRLPLQADSSDYSNNESTIHMMDLVQAPLTSADVKLNTSRDPVLSKVLELIYNG